MNSERWIASEPRSMNESTISREHSSLGSFVAQCQGEHRHLIAAAPEMYEALQWCFRQLELLAKEHYPDTDIETRRYTSARNAAIVIAKAEGRDYA